MFPQWRPKGTLLLFAHVKYNHGLLLNAIYGVSLVAVLTSISQMGFLVAGDWQGPLPFSNLFRFGAASGLSSTDLSQFE